MESPKVTVIGGGLAGSEAAWQIAQRGISVNLYEMRPVVKTPAHSSDKLAEIVCSNSFKSNELNTASYLLKEELRRAGSLLLEIAENVRVPAGAALAIDREKFASQVTQRISSHPKINLIREELSEIPLTDAVIIATGPLTSPSLTTEIVELTDTRHLYFFDAISPVVEADTINYDTVFRAARYGKGGDDYLNCPFTKEQYELFLDALLSAERVTPKEFESSAAKYFESCLPIEVAAERGRETLRFGPMKPVGLVDPRTGVIPHAVVQLRQENLMADSYNIVGFQNSIKWGAQKQLLRMVPGLENAEFLKFGQIHRNTYINAPQILNSNLQVKDNPRIFFAGQISGVEGYVESIATGLVAGIQIVKFLQENPLIPVPRESAIGSLLHYVAHCEVSPYQPANITFALLPPLEENIRRRIKSKPDRKALQVKIALGSFDNWLSQINHS